MFIQIIQGRVADAGAAREALDRWVRELAPGSHGWLGTTAGMTDDGTLVAVVRFETPGSARRNSDRPEQGEWWLETAKLFSGEVAFHNCSEVEEYLRGGSDAAGFVQVIQGRIRNPARMRELVRRTEQELSEVRPDLIGGTAALHDDDGGYTETAYFTSEEAAREGERKELPPRIRESFEELMSLFEGDPVYFDLRDPWLYSPK